MKRISIVLSLLIILSLNLKAQVQKKVFGWGRNTSGTIGDGTIVNKSSPVNVITDTVASPTPDYVLKLQTFHAALLKTGGALWLWGSNVSGQVGIGTTADMNHPVQLCTDLGFSAVSVGDSHSLGIKSDSTLWAWGSNAWGQLGDSSSTADGTSSFYDAQIPIKVDTNKTWVAIATGGFHSLALKADGTLWAWGKNSSGQLGNSSTVNSNKPIKIGTGTTWVKLFAGAAFSVAMKSDGTLWAWGSNSLGQLGVGSTTAKTVPTKIGTATNWLKIAVGSSHVLALKTDSSLWAWGWNGSSQLGNGLTTNLTSPTQIGTDKTWVGIAGGYSHSLAIKVDSSLWAWGANAKGQLGDGTLVAKTTPTRIGTDYGWTAVAAGTECSLGIKTAAIADTSSMLRQFNAMAEGNQTNIKWYTASEKNVDHFDIERSVDMVNFTRIASVKADATKTKLNSRFSYDKNPAPGKNYYRLIQYGTKGKSTISEIKEVDFNAIQSPSAASAMLWPNPTNKEVNISIKNYNFPQISVRMVDAFGTPVDDEQITRINGVNTYKLTTKTLRQGIYYIYVKELKTALKLMVL